MSEKQFLIRIHSLSNDGNFDALFSEEIIVKPNSHIALKNLHFLRGAGDFIIDGTNNSISFQIEDTVDGYGGQHTIVLDSKTYTKENISLLLQDITDKINSKLDIRSQQEFGTQVKMFLNNDSKIHYRSLRNGLAFFAPELIGPSTTNPYYVATGLTATDLDDISTYDDWFNYSATVPATVGDNEYNQNFMYYSIPFTKGCGVARLTIQKFVNADLAVSAGMVLGLMAKSKEEKLINKTWKITDLDYYIRTNPLNTTGGNYRAFPTTNANNPIAPINVSEHASVEDDYRYNDQMEIKISEGKITQTIHIQQAGDYESFEVGSQDYPYNTSNEPEFYVVVSILGDASTTKVLNIQGNTDPFKTPVNLLDKPKLKNYKTEFTTMINPNPHDTASVYNLTFGSIVMASAFGYDSLSQNTFLRKTVEANYIAERVLSKFLFTDSFLFELLNLSVVSYDSYNERYSKSPGAMLGGRRNLIATNILGVDGLESERIYYQPNELMFIALDNKNTLSLRSIKARIVSSDYSTIEVDGIAEATLVIKET